MRSVRHYEVMIILDPIQDERTVAPSLEITSPGFWMVRTMVKLDEKGAGYEGVSLRSILSFPVK